MSNKIVHRVEAAAQAMISEMFAPHELPLSDELQRKYMTMAGVALFAADAVAPNVANWQPIETAPRGDDDFFLVCGVGDERSPFVVRGSILWNARKPNTPSHLHLHYLTHWMPLPEPPK